MLAEDDIRAMPCKESHDPMLTNILIVILILMLIGALPTWPHSASWGYLPSGTIGILIVILIVLLLTGRL